MANVLITGANRGIGRAMAEVFLSRGDTVIGVGRRLPDDTDALSVYKDRWHFFEGVDVTHSEVLAELPARIQATMGEGFRIDILINNAGILADEVLSEIDYDSIERQFMVNALAPLRVSETFLSSLAQGAKIGLVTSRMGSMEDNTSGGRYGYRMSKAALNAAGVSLAQDLKPKGIAVALLHPGYVQTDMVGGRGDIPASLAAERLVARIDELNVSNSGSFWHANGETLPW